MAHQHSSSNLRALLGGYASEGDDDSPSPHSANHPLGFGAQTSDQSGGVSPELPSTALPPPTSSASQPASQSGPAVEGIPPGSTPMDMDAAVAEQDEQQEEANILDRLPEYLREPPPGECKPETQVRRGLLIVRRCRAACSHGARFRTLVLVVALWKPNPTALSVTAFVRLLAVQS